MMFRVSAPGSLMVLGEYGVLHGQPALVGAINARMTVTLTPRQDKVVQIVSALGEYRTRLDCLLPKAPFQFVLTALNRWRNRFPTGFDLLIESGFSSTMGFGSSAAVTVATLSAVRAFLQAPAAPEKQILEARQVVRAVQGGGSGADVAACVLGGLVAYCAKPLTAEKLPCLIPFSLLYSGSKTPTPVVMDYVRERFSARKAVFLHLIKAMGLTSREGIEALRTQDLARLGTVMNIQQGLLGALGVSNGHLEELVARLRDNEAIFGAKISGSGLGDCVIGVGEPMSGSLPVTFSSKGVAQEL